MNRETMILAGKEENTLIKKLTIGMLLLSIFLLISSSLYSQSMFSLTSTGTDYTEIEFNLSEYELIPVEVDGVKYQRLYHPEAGYLMEKGLPELLTFSVAIAVPERGTVKLTAPQIKESELISEMSIFPSQGFDLEISEETGFLKDEAFYVKDIQYPDNIALVSSPAIMRNLRLVSVTINPFTYNPERQELQVIERLSLRLDYNIQEQGENEITRQSQTISRSFENFHRNSVINYEQFRDPSLQYQHRSIIVVHNDSPTIVPVLNQYLNWKRDKGFEVAAISTANYPSANAIKGYIQNAFDNWENPPEYIVIIGGATGTLTVPTWSAHAGPTDHTYTLLSGNDDLADVFVGRISVNSNIQLATFWNKLQNYERTPYMDQTDWYEHNLLVGDPRTSGISTIHTSRYIKEIMLLNNENYSFTEVYDVPFPSQMYSGFNSGISFFSFRGLGGVAGWSPGDETLYNGYKLPNVTLITCGTLDMQGGVQVEPLFRMGTPTSPKGALSVTGMTTSLTATAFNNCLTGGMFYGIFIDDMRTMGESLMRGKFNLWQTYGNSHWLEALGHSYWANLIGDPSLDIWVETPKPMNLTYDEVLPLGTNSIDISVTDAQGYAIEDVWVTARQGNDVIFASDYTSDDGTVTLYFDPNNSGDVNLTVTKPDYIPHLGSFSLDGNPAVSLDEVIMGSDPVAGNTVNLSLVVKNHDSETAFNINGTISTNSEFIEIEEGNSSFGDILAGMTAESNTDFAINIAPDTPSGYIAQMNLVLEDNDGDSWLSRFTIEVQNGNIMVTELLINTNNGLIEPGEESDLSVELTNLSSIDVPSVYGVLRSRNFRIVVTDSTATFGDIDAEQSVVNATDTFSILAADYLLPGSSFNLELELYNALGYNQIATVVITVGQVTVNDPLGPDDHGYWVFDQQDYDYLERPDYDWIEIAPQLGGAGVNTGLESNFDNIQEVMTMDLPFTFRFYGETYDLLSICANGWISFGETEHGDQRNWRLPGPLAPISVVAAFWDNLSLEQGGVYTHYNETENFFVIQWQNARNVFGNVEETFQIILYDPMFYYTATADGPIKIQYKVFNNVNYGANSPGGIGNWGNYATVGIADHTCTVGLQYTFNNQYPTAAMPLSHEKAIYFTTGTAGLGTPYVAIDNYSYSDDPDYLPEYGETISMDMTLKNLGDQTAHNITAVLSSEDQFVSIIDNSADFGQFEPDDVVTVTDAYSIEFADDIPHGRRVLFSLEVIEEGAMSWTHDFFVTVTAPNLVTLNPIVYDPIPGGNDNGLIDPGEDVTVYLPIKNDSPSMTPPITINVTSDNPLANINSISETNFFQLHGEETLYPALSISISEDAVVGTVFPFSFSYQSGNYTFTGSFVLSAVGMYVQLGTGISTNAPTEASPVNIHYRSLRGQTVYTKDELNDQGVFGPGLIMEIGYHVTSPPLYSLPNFIVRMKHTTAESASSHDNGPFETVFGPQTYQPSNGWDMLTFGEPFFWNGVDNILVDTAFSQAQSFNSSGQIYVYHTENGFRYTRLDSFDQTNSPTNQVSTNKPQVKMMVGSYVSDDYSLKPVNLTASVPGNYIQLAWDSPETERDGNTIKLSGSQGRAKRRDTPQDRNREFTFNVYRNGILLNNEPIAETEFSDGDWEIQTDYYYYVTTIHPEGESLPSNIVSIQLSGLTEAPSFSPPGGYYNSIQTVSITCDTDGAEIYYTLDGADPDMDAILYTQPFELPNQTLTIVKAVAYADGLLPSEIETAEYHYLQTIPTPEIMPRQGIFYDPVSVNISLPSDQWTIHYTTCGSEPTQDSSVYNEPFTLEISSTVKAKAFADGWQDSNTATNIYTILNPPTNVMATADGYDAHIFWESPMMPSLNRSYSADRDEAEIMTRKNSVGNRDKTEAFRQTLLNYRVYRSIGHPSNMEFLVELSADVTHYQDSDLTTGTYHYKVQAIYVEGESNFSNSVTTNLPATAAPRFNPQPGHYLEPIELVINSMTENAQIYYTLDETTPDEYATLYTQPVFLEKDTTVKAVAISAEWGESEVMTGVYTIETSDVDEMLEPSLSTTLHSAYPNPFNPSTTLSFSLAQGDNVVLEVYNIAGRRVKTLFNGRVDAGRHSYVWYGDDDSGRRMSSGVYFYKLQTNSVQQVRKLLMLK